MADISDVAPTLSLLTGPRQHGGFYSLHQFCSIAESYLVVQRYVISMPQLIVMQSECMQAIAKAAALAITAVSADCVIEGQGHACALGVAEITETAEVCSTILPGMGCM